MAKLHNKHQPSFSLFPLNNNRTGWQPVNIPLLLIVPHVRSKNGITIANSNIQELIFFIEDTPGKSPVAAPSNIGIFVPTFERFRITITSDQLANVKINPEDQRFFNENEEEKSFNIVENNDLMEYKMLRNIIGAFNENNPGPIDRIPYLKHADYYDLSPFIIETINLPEGKYNFVYQAKYFERVIGPNDDFICINDEKTVTARFSMLMNHPGDVLQSMYKNTPAFYFSENDKSKDTTIAFYRPFADALQDIFDEQEFIKSINQVDNIPSEYIPYLAYLIGIDMPYFPTTTDNIRRSLLRNAKKIQQLKGSKRAITELFSIFGLIINIIDLWYSKDGTRFIGPNEKLPEALKDQEITEENICTSEPLLSEYQNNGFGQVEIPLLFRPTNNITINGWLVQENSKADDSLKKLTEQSTNNINFFETNACQKIIGDFIINNKLHDDIEQDGIIGHTILLVNQDGDVINNNSTKTPVLNNISTSYNKTNNTLFITFDHYIEFDNQKLYAFATYNYNKIIIPDTIKDLKSNRFDIDVLLFKDGTTPTFDVLQFLLEFLFRFKAFHSLLRKIIFKTQIVDVYNVTDLCIGGEFVQDPSTDIGSIQVPPPTIPDDNIIDICDQNKISNSSKQEDINLRNTILKSLEEEHTAWKNLTGKYDIPDHLLPILTPRTNISFNDKSEGNCEYTQHGQERVIDSNEKDFDHTPDDRLKLCDLNNNTLNYCYNGRLKQEIATHRSLKFNEIFRCRPCDLTGGIGTYYLTNLKKPDELANTQLDLTNNNNLKRSYHDSNYVRLMAFDNPVLHYIDTSEFADFKNLLNNRYYATKKPSLEIVKDNMCIPGHRFISMANLKNDFIHPTYKLRPWDDIFDIKCPPLNVDIPNLNVKIIEDTNGDEFIVYDEADLIYYGNGVDADIPSMGDHTLSPIKPNDVTHSIWSSNSPGLSFEEQTDNDVRYVIDQTIDGLRYTIREFDKELTSICFTDLLPKTFDSSDDKCECSDLDNALIGESLDNINTTTSTFLNGTLTGSNLTGGADFIDGYSAEFGKFIVDLNEFDYPREKLEGYGFSIYGTSKYGLISTAESLGPSLALHIPQSSKNIVELNFKIGSAIRVNTNSNDYNLYKPYRLDCGCTFAECQSATTTNSNISKIDTCHLQYFETKNGIHDWHCDKIIMVPRMILSEKYGASGNVMDGSIQNMMVFNDPDEIIKISTLFPELKEGNFQFIDDYGIIYIVSFEMFDNSIDITTQIRDPRVWGKEPAGEVINWKVFKDGIITTERNIIQISDDLYTIVASGSEQTIERFQTTFGCNDDVFSDPFTNHLDSYVSDDISINITPSTDPITTTNGNIGFGEGGFGEGGFGM